MKKIIIIILISIFACSEKKESMLNQNPSINANNIVDEISKQVKHYPKEPMYAMRQFNDLCYFEVFIDDFPFLQYFGSKIPRAIDVNRAVFKSGVYRVNYKLYPLGSENNYKINYPTLNDETNLKFSLDSYDLKNEEADEIKHSEYSVPKVEKKISEGYSEYTFEGAGKTFYEGSFNINVDVPYELKPPFENAKDLRKMDRKELETKLLKKYREVRDIYQNKDYDNIARLEYDALKMLYVSNYDSKETIKENWDEYLKAYKSPSFEMQPIENYKIEFFGNGKLAALMLDTTDKKLRGNTALWAKVNYNGGLRPLFLTVFCYIPQGETEFKVY